MSSSGDRLSLSEVLRLLGVFDKFCTRRTCEKVSILSGSSFFLCFVSEFLSLAVNHAAEFQGRSFECELFVENFEFSETRAGGRPVPVRSDVRCRQLDWLHVSPRQFSANKTKPTLDILDNVVGLPTDLYTCTLTSLTFDAPNALTAPQGADTLKHDTPLHHAVASPHWVSIAMGCICIAPTAHV